MKSSGQCYHERNLVTVTRYVFSTSKFISAVGVEKQAAKPCLPLSLVLSHYTRRLSFHRISGLVGLSSSGFQEE